MFPPRNIVLKGIPCKKLDLKAAELLASERGRERGSFGNTSRTMRGLRSARSPSEGPSLMRSSGEEPCLSHRWMKEYMLINRPPSRVIYCSRHAYRTSPSVGWYRQPPNVANNKFLPTSGFFSPLRPPRIVFLHSLRGVLARNGVFSYEVDKMEKPP